jgi:hypothetical protein
MNQNIRTAFHFLTEEIRLAGCDPRESNNHTIFIANRANLSFGVDRRQTANPTPPPALIYDGILFDNPGPPATNPQPNELIRYALTNDADGDGITDNKASACHLGRSTGGGALQVVAENIDALRFEYFGFDANDNVINLGVPVPLNNLNDIRFIRMTVVARSGQALPGFFRRHTDNQAYTNGLPAGQGEVVVLPAQNDSFRRLALTAWLDLRNMKGK